MTWPILAALGVFLAVWLHEDAETRLGALASHDRRRGAAADRGARGKPWPVGHMRMVHDAGHRVSVGAELAALAAQLRAGRDVHTAFDRCFGAPARGADGSTNPPRSGQGVTAAGAVIDCNGDIYVDLLAEALHARALPGETDAEIRHASCGLRAACRLGLRLGCPTARCVEAVRAAHARIHMREELRRNAFAVPQSTVKMLLGLPVVTVALGEVLGADPIGVLFGSWQGLCCLGLGVVCYAFGAVWMHRLMQAHATDGGGR